MATSYHTKQHETKKIKNLPVYSIQEQRLNDNPACSLHKCDKKYQPMPCVTCQSEGHKSRGLLPPHVHIVFGEWGYLRTDTDIFNNLN